MNDAPKLYQLCSTCAAIVEKSSILRLVSLGPGIEAGYITSSQPQNREFYEHLTAGALLLSANEGCHLCSILYEQYRRYYYKKDHGRAFSLVIWANLRDARNDSHETKPVHLALGDGDDLLHDLLLPRLGISRPDTQSFGDSEPRLAIFGLDTSSDEWFNKINTWLNACRNGHAHCHVTAAGAQLPARLLDVGTLEQGTEIPRVRLCTTHSMEARPEYLALSHCWGRVEILRLTKESSDEFFHYIPEDKLPATFHDAITVTRRLGFRYLWIDSLCIFQDSAQDWETESAKMGDVYRCAVLNISAVWGDNPYAGLFTPCQPLRFKDCVLQIDARPVRIEAYKPWKRPHGPLLSRGWAFLERLLCPRTLYYDRGTLMWECVQHRAGEQSDDTLLQSEQVLDDWFPKSYVHDIAKRLRRSEDDKHSEYGPKQLGMYQPWYIFLENYTRQEFSKQTDRLVAMRGLFRFIGCEDSVAGLRKDIILPELLWVTYPNSYNGRSTEGSYIAPSWSWASIDKGRYASFIFLLSATPNSLIGGHWQHRSIQWTAEVLETNIEQRPNGQVAGGHLKIRAPLIKMDHHPEQYGGRWYPDTCDTNLSISGHFGLLIARVRGEHLYMDYVLVLMRVPDVADTFRRSALFENMRKNPYNKILFQPDLSNCQKSIIYLR
ncbi:heterokaryon incompatibility protein-domain-containing protein [Nemania sp. FL0916]|nr:heterokaryon incompatibility protein-domain-containing protein [Nemania sp. FL0916]